MGVYPQKARLEPRLLVMCECRAASTCPSVYNDSAPVKNLRRHYIRARIFERTGLQLLAADARSHSESARPCAGITNHRGGRNRHSRSAPEISYDALKVDQYDVAVREFRAALTADPALSLRARFPLAVALFELHQSDEARRELELVRREVGDHPNVFFYLGRLDWTITSTPMRSGI